MPEYDEQRFLDLTEALNEIIWELLDMEGNTQEIIQGEVDIAFEAFGGAE